MPKLSVIVPVYNAERFLERCVRSILDQTMTDLEVILVDDSSTDASLALCRRLETEDGRVRVITKENEGAGRARNAALDLASGTYIGFVDSDDYVSSEMFERLIEKAEEHSADLVLSGVIHEGGIMFSEDGACETVSHFDTETVFETKEDLRALQLGIVGARPEDKEDSRYGTSIWKNLFRAELIRTHNLRFESEREMLSEDALFLLDFLAHATRAVGIPDAFYHYIRNDASISKSYKADRFEKSLVFLAQAEARIKPTAEETVYLDRFWQAICRVVCVQEILFAKGRGVRAVCSHPQTQAVLRRYPLSSLPLGQRVFAYAMKYKQKWLLTLLVQVRNNMGKLSK